MCLSTGRWGSATRASWSRGSRPTASGSSRSGRKKPRDRDGGTSNGDGDGFAFSWGHPADGLPTGKPPSPDAAHVHFSVGHERTSTAAYEPDLYSCFRQNGGQE